MAERFKTMDDLKIPRHTATKMAELFETMDDFKLSRAMMTRRRLSCLRLKMILSFQGHIATKTAELFETMDDLKLSRTCCHIVFKHPRALP